ncbi:MAG: AAA family ATPase [Alphaproteobacteria bacterium]|nr:AAA family ATPase [Alphaproteobacteria bacterium]
MAETKPHNSPRAEIGNILPLHNNMIAIASGKPGVGKTWFAVTLANALSAIKQKILFFDGDLGLSNIDIQLGLATPHDLSCVVTGNTTLNQIIKYNEKAHFDIISGRGGSQRPAAMPLGRLQILAEDLSLLSTGYDRVLLDIEAGTNKASLTLSGMAGNLIVLCTDEPSSLTDAYALIKIISSQYPECQISVVVNQADSIQEGQRTYDILRKACHSFLKLSPPLLGIVRRDARIRDTIRNQMPLLVRYPTSEAAVDVVNIARKLLQ